jgi:hypothetical protein
MKYNDWLTEEVLKALLEANTTTAPPPMAYPRGASASANGHYTPDAQKFKGKLPDEEDNIHDDDPNAEELLLGQEDEEELSLQEAAKKMNIESAWQAIPSPELSELGWADPSKSSDGKLTNKSRNEVSNYLSSSALKANTLEGQLRNLETLLKEAGKKEMTVSEILSFLVFYKTLTFIVSDFNPATAGFLFESLLGVLSGGHQIAAAGAGGGDTIADFVYKRGAKSTGGSQYVSLKLLTEGGTGIGGSFRDLIKDMKAKGGMQYIVVLKRLTGDKTDVEGSLIFYEFDFSASTFLDLLTDGGKKVPASLILVAPEARQFVDADGEEHEPIMSKSKWNEWIANEATVGAFIATLHSAQSEDGKWDFSKASDSLGAGIHRMAPRGKTGDLAAAMAKDASRVNPSRFGNILQGAFLSHDDSDNPPKAAQAIPHTYTYLRNAWAAQNAGSHSEEALKRDRVEQLGNELKRKSRGAAKKDTYSPPKKSGHNWMTLEQSLEELSSLSDDELWDVLQRYSRGYLTEGQFEITQKEMKTQTGDPFATLTVGRSVIADVMGKMVNDVNQKMFDIYSQLNMLKDNLREFFMKDLDAEQGTQAKKSANKVAYTTGTLVQTASKKK